MSPEEAREVLGLTGREDAAAIRARHRRLIGVAHPDRGGDAAVAARVNEAFAVLTGPAGEQPATARPAGAEVEPPAADRVIRLEIAPRRLLDRLVEAATDIGEVTFIDVTNGVLQVVVGSGRATAQLVVTVGADPASPTTTDGVPVAFTLEPLDPGGVAEPIGGVVDRLLTAVRRAD